MIINVIFLLIDVISAGFIVAIIFVTIIIFIPNVLASFTKRTTTTLVGAIYPRLETTTAG